MCVCVSFFQETLFSSCICFSLLLLLFISFHFYLFIFFFSFLFFIGYFSIYGPSMRLLTEISRRRRHAKIVFLDVPAAYAMGATRGGWYARVMTRLLEETLDELCGDLSYYSITWSHVCSHTYICMYPFAERRKYICNYKSILWEKRNLSFFFSLIHLTQSINEIYFRNLITHVPL